MPNLPDITKEIAAAQADAGKTDEDIAEALGLALPSVKRWRKGKHHPAVNRLPDLAEFLGINHGERNAWVEARIYDIRKLEQSRRDQRTRRRRLMEDRSVSLVAAVVFLGPLVELLER